MNYQSTFKNMLDALGNLGQDNTYQLSETERIIKDLDVNNLSPMQAFAILTDLQEKVKGDI